MTAPRALRALLRSADDTHALGRAVGGALEPGAVVALVGPLGAGKTTFVQGLAMGLGLPDSVPVQSPTFTICNEYLARVPILHADLYRLANVDEAEDIGLLDRLRDGAGIGVVEWASRVPGVVPEDALWIRLEHDEHGRTVTLAEGDGGDVGWVRGIALPGSDAGDPWSETDGPMPWED